MAVTVSGLFYPTFAGVLANTIALDLSAETYKGALISNSATPNFSTHDLWADLSGNEVYGTGWAQGGVALTGTTISESPTGSLRVDADNVSQETTTLTNARAYVWYASALSNELICLVDFDADYSTVAGTLAIAWDAAGLFAIDLTP